MMWHHWPERLGSCGWHPGAVIALVLLVVLVALAVWGIAAMVRHGLGRADKGNGAMAIARERYARGEINKGEFDQLRKDLH